MTYIDIDVNGLKSLINHLYKDKSALEGNLTLKRVVRDTKAELDGWQQDIYLAYHNDLPMTNWYQTFAWLPTETMDHGLVWLCHIWKRRVKHRNLIGQPTYYTQYLAVDPYADAVDVNTLYPQTSGVVSTDEIRGAQTDIHIIDETMDWMAKYDVNKADGGTVQEVKNDPTSPYSPYYGINYKSDPFGEEKP